VTKHFQGIKGHDEGQIRPNRHRKAPYLFVYFAEKEGEKSKQIFLQRNCLTTEEKMRIHATSHVGSRRKTSEESIEKADHHHKTFKMEKYGKSHLFNLFRI